MSIVDPDFYYHYTTRENLNKIRSSGVLRPSVHQHYVRSLGNGVYVTDCSPDVEDDVLRYHIFKNTMHKMTGKMSSFVKMPKAAVGRLGYKVKQYPDGRRAFLIQSGQKSIILSRVDGVSYGHKRRNPTPGLSITNASLRQTPPFQDPTASGNNAKPSGITEYAPDSNCRRSDPRNSASRLPVVNQPIEKPHSVRKNPTPPSKATAIRKNMISALQSTGARVYRRPDSTQPQYVPLSNASIHSASDDDELVDLDNSRDHSDDEDALVDLDNSRGDSDDDDEFDDINSSSDYSDEDDELIDPDNSGDHYDDGDDEPGLAELFDCVLQALFCCFDCPSEE